MPYPEDSSSTPWTVHPLRLDDIFDSPFIQPPNATPAGWSLWRTQATAVRGWPPAGPAPPGPQTASWRNWVERHGRLDMLMLLKTEPRDIQGDHSPCSQPPVDTKTNVAFYYMGLILKRNFCFAVNGRYETTWMGTLYLLRRMVSHHILSCCNLPPS